MALYPSQPLFPQAGLYPGGTSPYQGEPSYTVRIAWEPESLDVITFGLSRFSEPGPAGTDPPGTNTFAGSFDAIYADVSRVVTSLSVRRGRDSNLSTFGAGEAVITLKDTNGTYSPLNTSSPLYPNVLPGRNVLVSATWAGAELGVYRGFVRSIEYDPGAYRTTIHAQDLFLYLSRAKPVITNTGTITTGAAIGTVLTAIDWTETAYRSLGTGDTINAGFASNAEASGLELIEGFIETERGEAFHSKDGVFTYRDRYARYKRQSAGTLTNVTAEAVAATDLTNVRNRAKVVKTGGGTATWTDYASATNYGYADYSPIDSPYINNAAQGTALAQWLVAQGKDPSPPIRQLRFTANRADSLMVQALSRDLGDRITVADSAIAGTADFYIEGIDHVVKNGGKLHEVAYTLSKVPTAAPIIFGTSSVYPGSRFGGADIFAF